MAAVQSAAQHSTNSSARPAEPLLASSLIDASSLDTVLEFLSFTNGTPSIQPEPLRTGVASLDNALGSTLQGGRVVALSSESSPRDNVAKALLVDCLVKHTESTVAVVDTTGSFDVVGLYKLILKRLENEPEKVAEMRVSSGDSGQGIEGVAAKVLDRVKIMRVFDFVGMREAVGELGDGLEGRMARAEVDGASEEIKMVRENATAAEVVTEKVPSPPSKKTEIADSEDEDEGIEGSDDEMLFDTTAQPPDLDPLPIPAADAMSPPAQAAQQTALSHAPQPKLKLILIDNLSHVLTPLLKRDTISANTLATTFLTTLLNLTRTHALHTILLNPCASSRAPSPTRKPVDTAPSGPQQAYTPQPPPPPSIFSSNLAVPALLGLMSRYVDAHMLISMLPRRKMDARVYYGDAGGRERGKRRGVEMVGVLEVVADRWGGRVGAWGAFREGKEGRGVERL